MPSSRLSPDLSAVFAAQHGLITREQAERHGLTWRMASRRIAAGVLDEPAPGVLRLVGATRTWEQRLMGVTLSSRGRAVASHRCAAALHGLDGFPRSIVEVSVTRPWRMRRAGTIVHQTQALDQHDLTTVAGIPVTGVARTLVDLGAVVDRSQVERALDDVRRRGISLRWIQATAERLHRPGQSGTGVLLALLEAAWTEPTVRGSWFERLVEECLRSSRPAVPRAPASGARRPRPSRRDPRPGLPVAASRRRGPQPAVPLRPVAGAGRRGPGSSPGPVRLGGPLRRMAVHQAAG